MGISISRYVTTCNLRIHWLMTEEMTDTQWCVLSACKVEAGVREEKVEEGGAVNKKASVIQVAEKL